MAPRATKAHACVMLALAGAAHAQIADPFPPVFELEDLTISGGGDGTLGTFLDVGPSGLASDGFGQVDRAGDVNGDGFNDLIVGDLYGSAYVVFGQAGGLGAELALAELDGDSGFLVRESDSSAYFGCAVAGTGDLNGDGLDDIAMGARGYYGGSYSYGGNPNGDAYVLFGRADPFPAMIRTNEIVSPVGARFGGGSYDYNGDALAGLGDINGDGIDDFGVGAPRFGSASNPTGRAYVVFGRPTTEPFPSSSPISTSAGLTLRSSIRGGFTGEAIAGIGDVNGDGVSDFAVSSPSMDSGLTNNGRVHVVFGRDDGSLTGDLDLASLDGANGFRIDGLRANHFLGRGISSAGDLNGDGIDDLAVGSDGDAYVIFGRPAGEPWPAEVELDELDGSNGLVLAGFGTSSPTSLAGRGDLNGDGYDDLLVGSYAESSAYVVYGRPDGFARTIDVGDLDGVLGFRISGSSLLSVHSAGDMNADGAPDAAIRTPRGVFIVHGRSGSIPCPADLDGDGELTIFDFLVFQNLFDAGDLAADFDGDGSLTIFDFLAFQNAFDTGCP